MQASKIIIATLFAWSCSGGDPSQKIINSARKQYKGSISASVVDNGNGLGDILLELTDSVDLSRANNMPEMAGRISRAIYYEMDSTARMKIESVKLIFMSSSKVYARHQVFFKTIFKEDSAHQEVSCSLLPNYIAGATKVLSLREISETDFYRLAPTDVRKIQPYKPHQHSDSLEHILNSKFKDKFERIGDCYFFHGGENQEKGFCRGKNPKYERESEYYKLIGKENDFFVFEVTRYEDGEYWIFNSSNGNVFTLPSTPHFSHQKRYVYSVGGLNETDVTIHDTQKDVRISISWPDSIWMVSESYFLNEEGVRIKLISRTCKKGEKYIDLHFN